MVWESLFFHHALSIDVYKRQGPNGAGKTTTISLLSTLLLPTKGEILIDGQQLTRQRPDLKRKISVPIRKKACADLAQAFFPLSGISPGQTCADEALGTG